MARLAIMVESRGVDLTAITAAETLRNRLGYGRVLRGLERADLWGVWTSPAAGAPGAVARNLIEATSVFVNPNKHRWRVWAEGAAGAERAAEGAWVLVWDSEDTEGRGALSELRGSGFGVVVERVSKATLWRLDPAAEVPEGGVPMAKEIASAVHRDKGLLANPHMHRWAAGGGGLSLEDALGYLDGGVGKTL